MFCRFFKQVLERAPNAFLECRSELYELFEYSGVAPKGQLFRLGRTLPEYKFQCSLASMPWALGADEAMIRCPPYLKADPLLVKNFLGTGNISLARVEGGPLFGARIGLCGKGSSGSERAFTRDLSRQEAIRLSRACKPFFPLEQTGQFDSFAMTAAAIEALDLVVTVDTSLAHLAGAMGKETILLMSRDPDFRWGLKGETTPWYDSVRIFRQERFRDWPGVIDRVIDELRDRGYGA
jgi:hypothetical protein